MRIFLSYHNSNRADFIDKLTTALRAAYIDPLVIDLQVAVGEAILEPEKLKHNIGDCEHVVIVISKEYVNSEWLQKELLAFFLLEKMGQLQILPIRIDDCEIPLALRNRVVHDFRKAPFKTAFANLRSSIAKSRQVFIIMKFGDKSLDSAYWGAIRPVIEKFGYTPLRINDIEDSGHITDQILEQIKRSEIVLADLTGERPNCYYEAGYAQASGKEMIFTVRKDFPLHFDLAGYRFINWETEEDLRQALTKRLEAIQAKKPEQEIAA